MQRRQYPALTAIFSERQIGSIAVGLLVVAASNHSMQRIAKRNRKDPCGIQTMNHGSVENLPALPVIAGMEHARNRASGGEPDVGVGVGVATLNRNACIRR